MLVEDNLAKEAVSLRQLYSSLLDVSSSGQVHVGCTQNFYPFAWNMAPCCSKALASLFILRGDMRRQLTSTVFVLSCFLDWPVCGLIARRYQRCNGCGRHEWQLHLYEHVNSGKKAYSIAASSVKYNWKCSNWFAVLSGQDRGTQLHALWRSRLSATWNRPGLWLQGILSMSTSSPSWSHWTHWATNPKHPLSDATCCRPEYLVAGKPFFWHKTWVSLKTTMTRRWKIKTMHENVAPTNNGGFSS